MTVMISPSRIASLVVILFLSEPSAYCADAVRYTVKDLGEGVAVGINSAGSVLMNSNFRSAVKKGDGTSIHVGPEYGTATAINDVGDVVGKGSDDVVVGGAPYLWTPNGRSTYFEGELPLGLNNKRDMTIIYREPGTDCSTSGVPNSEDKAYAILDGKRIEVNNLNGSTNHVNSRAAAINSSGDFVGMANARECRSADPPQNETPRPFWYHQGRFSELSSEENYGNATLLNDVGQIVGQLSNDHAYILTNGASRDLGTLGSNSSEPKGLNNKGFVVGASGVNEFSDPTHAFLYENDILFDLNDVLVGSPPGLILVEAVGINDLGQIAANGQLGGYHKVFLLSPTAP